MKKLLALVLCVMMFVSVVPTSAFAGGLAVDVATNTVSTYNTQIKNMIKNTRTDVENSYKALVGDKVVYTSAKAMDDAIVGLVDAITDPLIEKGKANKAFADTVKAAVRSYFDATVAEKIEDNLYKALDKDGKIDDLKYAQLVSDSMSKALNDKTFVKGYQAVATYFALVNIVNDIRDDLKDEYQAFEDSVDADWEAKFAARYPVLVDDYIDTFATGTAKAIANSALWDALQEFIADAADERDEIVDEAAEEYAEELAALKEAYAEEKAALIEDYELEELSDDVKAAERELAIAEMLGDKDRIAEAKEALKEAEDAYKVAEKEYKAELKVLDAEYDELYEDAYALYLEETVPAQYDYQVAVAEATLDYEAGVQYINPWAEYVRPSTDIKWWS